jgi:hypothetical protein
MTHHLECFCHVKHGSHFSPSGLITVIRETISIVQASALGKLCHVHLFFCLVSLNNLVFGIGNGKNHQVQIKLLHFLHLSQQHEHLLNQHLPHHHLQHQNQRLQMLLQLRQNLVKLQLLL